MQPTESNLLSLCTPRTVLDSYKTFQALLETLHSSYHNSYDSRGFLSTGLDETTVKFINSLKKSYNLFWRKDLWQASQRGSESFIGGNCPNTIPEYISFPTFWTLETSSIIPSYIDLTSDREVKSRDFEYLHGPFHAGLFFCPLDLLVEHDPDKYIKGRCIVVHEAQLSIMRSKGGKISLGSDLIRISSMFFSEANHLLKPIKDLDTSSVQIKTKESAAFLASAMFLSQKYVALERHSWSRQARRDSERRKRPLPEVSTVSLRRQACDTSRGSTEGSGEPDWQVCWLRSPHWRRQWIPSKKTHEPRYIIETKVRGNLEAPMQAERPLSYVVNR